MRLIDADELIKSIEQGEGFSWDSHGKDDLCVRKKYIDNAPPVEPKLSDKQIEEIADLLEIQWGYEGIREDVSRILRGEETGNPYIYLLGS